MVFEKILEDHKNDYKGPFPTFSCKKFLQFNLTSMN